MKITEVTSFGEALKMAVLTAVIGCAIFLGVSTALNHVNPPSKITVTDWNTLKTVKLSNASFVKTSDDDTNASLLDSMYPYKVTGVTDIKESITMYTPEQPKIKNNEFSGKYIKNDDTDMKVVVQTKRQYEQSISKMNKLEIDKNHNVHAMIAMAIIVTLFIFIVLIQS